MPQSRRSLFGVSMKRTFSLLLFAVLMVSASRSAFSSTTIAAKAWILIDENDLVLTSKNPSAKLPPASTTKLVTAMVALDHLDPAATVTVSKKAKATRSGRPRLQAGEELTVDGLLHLALMKSNNSAAVALAEATAGSEDAFVALMNRKAEELGPMTRISSLPRACPKAYNTQQHAI